MVQNVNTLTPEVNPKDLRYIPDRRLRTKAAADRAIRIVGELTSMKGSHPEEDEKDLFTALQTCAYRAARPERGVSISPAQRQQWARRYTVLREHIVEKHLGLVYSMTHRFNFVGGDSDDLLSDAMFALARAVERFSPWMGHRFSTYAGTAIARALRLCSRRSRKLPRQFPFENDMPIEAAEPVDAETDLYIERLRRVLHENLGELSDVETQVLSQRFPLSDERGSTLGVIGRAVGLSKERVRQIQNGALRKLRAVLNADPVLQ